ncbi:MAG TPA: rhomboid family intramembrane serine protease [Amycolatopsis sp.]|uniref:rhomboid family intramembrane serine protease n=1 Tax=Amycolatopsis sp. TaxID=37632 RepID=UPI002B499A7C|nr:rhomboid family intramembrane serine protease [Amycolatopsis sp.]HKS48919.1 rhomboid family intramembrane serine protease [Amycolatopsis sp.]
MIPVHDVNPLRRTPWVTYALIVTNVVVFLRMPAAAHSLIGQTTLGQLCQLQAFIERWGAVPVELLHDQAPALVPTGQGVVTQQGAGCLLGTPGYQKSPPLSVLTSMFLHNSWSHLLGNMLFLAIFGNNIEDRLGRIRFLLFYLACGYTAAYGYALTSSNSAVPLIGASGAIAGVLGAYLVIYPRARVWGLIPVLFFLPLRVPAWLMLGMWFLLQALYATGYGTAQAGSVAYAAHVIGFVLGALLGFTMRGRAAVH